MKNGTINDNVHSYGHLWSNISLALHTPPKDYSDSTHFAYHHYREKALAPNLISLCQIEFEHCRPSVEEHTIRTGLQQIPHSLTEERWVTKEIVQRGTSGNCKWSSFDNMMLIAAYINESTHLSGATNEAYTQIFKVLQEQQYPHLLRMWNYLPQINHGKGDNENYRQFCLGRKQAFDQARFKTCQYPAASALGHYSEGILVYALASKSSGIHIENPSQISAYKYPRQYGPQSPSFARATYANNILYISGTASVIGHNSIGEGNISLQTQTTVDNLNKLFEYSKDKINLTTTPKPTELKVYLRNPKDYACVSKMLTQAYPCARAIFLHADICRSDLLVEIDGYCITKDINEV